MFTQFRARFTPLLVVLVMGLTALACGGGSVTPEATIAAPTKEKPAATNTSAPKPAATRTPRPEPTDTQAPKATATQEAAANSGGETLDPDIAIMVEDLPKGFTELSEDDLAQLQISPESLEESMGTALSKATAQNFRAYLNADPKNFEVVLSVLFYPLTTLEKASFDIGLQNPENFLKGFSKGAGDNLTEPEVMADAEGIGDASLGILTSIPSEALALKMQIVIVRRDTIISMNMIMYQDTAEPVISAIELAKILDKKVANSLK